MILTTRLHKILETHRDIRFASSLGLEDMVLTHIILKEKLPIKIFTLNTGRLPRETIALIEKIHTHYGYEIEQYLPKTEAVESYIQDFGLNAFYESIDLRKKCCHIRKVEPLGRALQGADAWITGQRREQSVTRHELTLDDWDEQHGIAKYNPLFDWSEAQVTAYIQSNDIPVNALHARGYPSIGCEPCTRAIKPGEDSRAGRWWWEHADQKECGLHVSS